MDLLTAEPKRINIASLFLKVFMITPLVEFPAAIHSLQSSNKGFLNQCIRREALLKINH
jgi:hypothetical protein